MMSFINTFCRKSTIFVPLLLLCLLLLNGCARKKNITPANDPASMPASITEDDQEKDKKKEDKKEEEQKKKESGKKKRGKKKGRKTPPTQRPYVIEGRKYYPIPSAEGYEETGLASWYGDPFHGRKTANGETYDMHGVTAAHKTLPMNTMLLVKNLANGKTATVRINDRGPFVDGRIIDLSYTTARELGIYRRGTGKVQIVALCAAGEDKEKLKRVRRNKQKNGQQDREEYEEIIGALAEEDPEDYQALELEESGDRRELPLLAAHNKKKKMISSSAISGTQCTVILPNGKKKRIRQDFDTGNFYIQVGSFEEKTRARKLARIFAVQGRNVVIQEFAAAGTHFFRVLVFSSTSLKKAKQHKEKLKKQGYEHAFVIARDNPPKSHKKNAAKGSKGGRKKIAVN